MRLGALLSGGKDSILATCHAAVMNHSIECVLHLETSDEVDSFLIQSVGSKYVKTIAQAMDVPYIGIPTKGIATQKELYIEEIDINDETHDLFTLIQNAKQKFKLDGIISGAIESDYQRLRIEFICQKLNLSSFAPLWKSNPAVLFNELEIVDSMIVKVASLGLNQSHIGKDVVDIKEELMGLFDKYKIHPLGEGGEFETFTTYAPLYKKELKLKFTVQNDKQSSIAIISDAQFADISTPRSLDLLKSTRDFDLNTNEYTVPVLAPHNATILPTDFESTFSEFSNYFTLSNFFIFHKSDFDIDAQEGLKQLIALLKQRNIAPSDFLIVHVYIGDMSLFGKFNALYGKLFTIKPPARACVQASLPKNVLAKIDVIIAKPHYKRKVMHVASISHKYPANIGPYSQCQQPLVENGVSFIAGQVGFVPIKLAYPCAKDVKDATIKQNKYSSTHVKSITAETGIVPVTGVCFVRDSKYSKEIIQTFVDKFPNVPGFTVQVDRLPKDGEVEWLCMGMAKELKYTRTEKNKVVVFENEKAKIVVGNGDYNGYLNKNKMQSVFVKNLKWGSPSGAFIVPVNEITMDKTYDFAIIEIQ